MKIMHKNLIIVSLLSLPLFSGCGVLIQPALVPNKNVDEWKIIDPNDYGIQVTKQEDSSIIYHWSKNVDFDDQKRCIPYWKSKVLLNTATVSGQLNGKTYPVIFDTGNSLGVLIEDIQINRHGLPVVFFNNKNKHSSAGLAIVDSLKVGPFEFQNYPCNFLERRAEHRLLGLVPIHRYQWIVMPMEVIAALHYVEYDQVKKELCFSSEESFTPKEASEWITYPFEINKKRILLNAPIDGIEAVLFLDTGGYFELELDQSFVKQLYEKRPDWKKSWKIDMNMYAPYAGGKVKTKKFTASDLHLADHCFNRVELFYRKKPLKENQPLYEYEDTDGTIGMKLFEKTVMVLDFENNLMWVKKTKGSRWADQSK